MAIELGYKVRDLITGFEGIVVAITRWLHGCDRVTVQPDVLDDNGKVKEAVVFDDASLEVLEERKIPVANHTVKEVERRTGGPQNDAIALRRN